MLLHVRALCEKASGSKTSITLNESEITMLRYDPNLTLTLKEFNRVQENQINLALNQLRAIKAEIMDLCYVSCVVEIYFSFSFLIKMNFYFQTFITIWTTKDRWRTRGHWFRGILRLKQLYSSRNGGDQFSKTKVYQDHTHERYARGASAKIW